MTPQLSPESLEQIRGIVLETVSVAIAGLERRLEPRFLGIDQRFDAADQRLDAMDVAIAQVREETREVWQETQEIRRETQELRRETQELRQETQEVRRETRDAVAENRRHFGVLHEDLRTKLDLVIEGFNGLNQRMDRSERRTDERFDRVDLQILRLSARLPRPRKKR